MVAGIFEKSRRRRWARLLFIGIEKNLLFFSPTVPQVSWAAAPPVGNGETVFSSTCDARFFQEGNEIAFLRGRILFPTILDDSQPHQALDLCRSESWCYRLRKKHSDGPAGPRFSPGAIRGDCAFLDLSLTLP